MNALYLTDIKDLIKAAFTNANVYAGAIDTQNDKSIGVFGRTRFSEVLAIGGVENSSYNVLSTSVLIRWTESTEACEIMANSIYNYFMNLKDSVINNKKIIHSFCEGSGPIDLSRGERNICEMVVHANFYYER